MQQLCKSTKVKQLLITNKQELITIKSTESVECAFRLLINNRILSAPLYNEEMCYYMGFLHTLDILSYLLHIFAERNSCGMGFEELITQDKFKNEPCTAILEKSQLNPWRVVSEDASIYDVIHILAIDNLREVAVVDSNNKLVDIITQDTIINWLADIDPVKIGELVDMPLNNFKLGFKEVISMDASSTLLQVFIKMYSFNISGVAIKNNENTLIGNISISDLKDLGCGADKFYKLFMNAETFIQTRDYGKKVPNLVYVTPSTSIKELLQQFKTYSIHRVYIVQNNLEHAPVGIINSTDIISFFDDYLSKAK